MASAMEVSDYGGAPEEEERFSAVDDESKERKVSTMSAKLKKNKITGDTGETWVIYDVDGDLMTVYYDSGKKEWEVRRKCGYVFLKVGDVVVK